MEEEDEAASARGSRAGSENMSDKSGSRGEMLDRDLWDPKAAGVSANLPGEVLRVAMGKGAVVVGVTGYPARYYG